MSVASQLTPRILTKGAVRTLKCENLMQLTIRPGFQEFLLPLWRPLANPPAADYF